MSTDGEGRETRKLDENDLIRWWGTPKEYYEEKECFLKEHENAESRTFTNNGLLVGVTYYFKPYQVAVEQLDLLKQLEKASSDSLTDDED